MLLSVDKEEEEEVIVQGEKSPAHLEYTTQPPQNKL